MVLIHNIPKFISFDLKRATKKPSTKSLHVPRIKNLQISKTDHNNLVQNKFDPATNCFN